MNITAIITEYNPLHLGHTYLAEQVRKDGADCIVALQSGNYVQRGEPAIFNKYDRAKDAVKNGVDLVLELPYPWCMSSAKYFASAGINIIEKLGIKNIAFGSESGDGDLLKEVAQNLISKEFESELSQTIKDSKNTSKSDIICMSMLYEKIYGKTLPNTSNDILAIEYLKAIYKNRYDISFKAYKRIDSHSATLSRKGIKTGDIITIEQNLGKELSSNYASRNPVDFDDFSATVFAILGGRTSQDIARFADLGGGIAGLLCQSMKNAKNLGELISIASTKKYTDARLRRALFSAIFQITQSQLEEMPLYTTLLAANNKGCEFLHSIKKTSNIEILTKIADGQKLSQKAHKQFLFSQYADRVWESVAGNGPGAAVRHSAYIEPLTKGDS